MRPYLNQIKKLKRFTLKSQGKSMLPLFQPDDTLFFKKCSFSQCKVNDVILVQKNQHTITHRVVYKYKNWLITRGDNNVLPDSKTYPHQIIAKVEKIKNKNTIFDPNELYLIKSTVFFNEIMYLQNILKKKNIDFLFLKGLPLHLYVEGSHPRRPYFDCDLLIEKNKLRDVEEALRQKGYQSINNSLFHLQSTLKDKVSETSYWKLVRGVLVIFDLHTEIVFMMTQIGSLDNLYPQQRIDRLTLKCLSEKREVTINKNKFPLLSTDNLIVYLALHFFHHNYFGISRLELIANIIASIPQKKQKEIQKKIVSTINEYKLKNYVYFSYILLQRYFPQTKPFIRPILNSIQIDNIIHTYLRTLFQDVFFEENRTQAGVVRFKNLFYLSPEPTWKKLLVFFNIQTIVAVYWVGVQRVKNLIKRKVISR